MTKYYISFILFMIILIIAYFNFSNILEVNKNENHQNKQTLKMVHNVEDKQKYSTTLVKQTQIQKDEKSITFSVKENSTKQEISSSDEVDMLKEEKQILKQGLLGLNNSTEAKASREKMKNTKEMIQEGLREMVQ